MAKSAAISSGVRFRGCFGAVQRRLLPLPLPLPLPLLPGAEFDDDEDELDEEAQRAGLSFVDRLPSVLTSALVD